MLARTLPLACALPLLVLASGCDSYYHNFYTTTTSTPMLQPLNTKTTSKFNASLPDAVDEVFATCHAPLSISPTTTSVDMGGTCTSTSDLATLNAQIVWAGLATLPNIDLSDAFPTSVTAALTDIYHVDGVFPWPVQNCDVYMDFGGMHVNGLDLTGMVATWEMSPDGRPALRLHVEHDGTSFASGSIEGDVDCPNPLNEIVLQPNVPDGPTSIFLNNVDLDIWVDFTFSGSTVTAIADADVQIGSISISPALTTAVQNRVGSFQDMIEDFGGVSVNDIETDAANGITAELGSLETQLAALVQSAVPAGAKICSMTIGTGGNMLLKTAKVSCL